jgi:hypothetical protein
VEAAAAELLAAASVGASATAPGMASTVAMAREQQAWIGRGFVLELAVRLANEWLALSAFLLFLTPQFGNTRYSNFSTENKLILLRKIKITWKNRVFKLTFKLKMINPKINTSLTKKHE